MQENATYTDGMNLPYSLEAEQAVLGAVLMQPQCLDQVISDGLRAEQFYLPEHQAIYRVMSGKMMESQPIDFVTVLEALKADGFFSGEDGKGYLLKLAQMVPSISNVGNYARIIREKADVRQLIQAAREIAEDAMDPSVEPALLLDAAEQKIYDIRQDRQQGGLLPISEVLASNFEMFNKLASSERSDYVGIPSGISALDAVTTGLNRSDLIIVGARPGMGKTSFVLNVARNVAVQQKRTVAVFSLEMSREQLVNRLLSAEARVSSKKLRVGNLTADEWGRIATAARRAAQCADLPRRYLQHYGAGDEGEAAPHQEPQLRGGRLPAADAFAQKDRQPRAGGVGNHPQPEDHGQGAQCAADGLRAAGAYH